LYTETYHLFQLNEKKSRRVLWGVDEEEIQQEMCAESEEEAVMFHRVIGVVNAAAGFITHLREAVKAFISEKGYTCSCISGRIVGSVSP
jgi:hypothetical protein